MNVPDWLVKRQQLREKTTHGDWSIRFDSDADDHGTDYYYHVGIGPLDNELMAWPIEDVRFVADNSPDRVAWIEQLLIDMAGGLSRRHSGRVEDEDIQRLLNRYEDGPDGKEADDGEA